MDTNSLSSNIQLNHLPYD